MESWEILPVKSGPPFGFKWFWRRTSGDGRIDESKAQFEYYYDCVLDAQAHGYQPPPPERLR